MIHYLITPNPRNIKRYLPHFFSLLLFCLSLQDYLTHRSQGGWRTTGALVGVVVFGIMTLIGLYTLIKKTN